MKKIYLVGAGMGRDCLTAAAQKAVDAAEVIIGAKRLVDSLEKQTFAEYRPEFIREYIDGSDKNTFCVLLSGDTGFYSGAKAILAALDGYDTQVLAGISSFAYFFAAIKRDYNDVVLASLHGRKCSAVSLIKRHKRVFFLLDAKSAGDIIDSLCLYNMGDTRLYIGESLSYPDERITVGTAAELKDRAFDTLTVMLAENDGARSCLGSIPDGEFIRGNVPMTKAEIRALSIAKLGLCEDSILYDIGAGTGSVSVEAAQYLPRGSVYAFEKNAEALELIQKNKIKFAADNLYIVAGEVPQSLDLDKYPVPTHAFVGGSGDPEKTLDILFGKNRGLRAVMTAVTLETLSALTRLSKKYSTEVCCINAARAESAGAFHLMKANNPVYIAVLTEKNNE